MEPIIQTLPQLAPYAPAFSALIILCLVVLVQGFLAGILGLAGGEEVAGMPLKGDHSKFSFRTLRTYHNSIENFSIMVTTTFLAILAGVSVLLVNWLVGIHVLVRIAYWAVYYSGIGKVGGGIRTITYVVGFFMNVILALATVTALLF